MKKKVRTWMLIFGMSSPMLFSGCLGTLGKEVRDAAFQGAANAVRDTVFGQVLGVLPADGE